MLEIRWLGRGGQGAFTAAKIIGEAQVLKGEYALSFPSFGPERRGAPLQAFTKLSDEKVTDRTEIVDADYIVILDESLYSEDLLDDLKPGGRIILNSTNDYNDDRIISGDGLHLALEILGIPITNTAMVGIFIGVSQILDLDHVLEALSNQLSPSLYEKNAELIKRAYEEGRGLNSEEA